jgi:outer membrane lipoprotein
MRMQRTAVLAAGLWLVLLACASSQQAGESSSGNSINFLQVKDTPDSYRGQSVVFGGEVLSAKRLKDGTRVEVLQLPLDRSGQPDMDRTKSQGRFIAVQRDFLDPATIPPGSRVSVSGELAGAMTLPLDDTEYSFPVIELRHIEVLPPPDFSRAPSYYPYYPPYYGPYGGTYWRPWPYRW